jgi:acyl dehydratase
MAEALPSYTVKARNTSTSSENKIHDDAVAKTYGFRGGLVPGVTVYAYLTRPLVATLGPAWLDRGTASVRFAKPVFDGEEATVTGEITERTARGLAATLRLATAANGECAAMAVTLPAGLPTPINPARYGDAPVPTERPDATRERLGAIDVLGSPAIRYDEAEALAYLERVADDLAVYRGAKGRAHPAFYLQLANRALTANVRMPAWIHVGSVVRHLAPARVGQTLAMRGRVRSLFEKKGREFVELDLALIADGKAVAHILHTAIYRLPAPPQ